MDEIVVTPRANAGFSDEGIDFVNRSCQHEIETQLTGGEDGKVRSDFWGRRCKVAMLTVTRNAQEFESGM